MVQLKEAMLLLIANDAPLGSEWLDHALKGDWADHRECHIGGDFLLIYQLEGNQLNFVRAGSHADLFGSCRFFTDGAHFRRFPDGLKTTNKKPNKPRSKNSTHPCPAPRTIRHGNKQ